MQPGYFQRRILALKLLPNILDSLKMMSSFLALQQWCIDFAFEQGRTLHQNNPLHLKHRPNKYLTQATQVSTPSKELL